MNLRQLKHFLAIAEAGSILGAANRLGVAQPSLSRDVKLLETELSARLFRRDGRGVSLTRDGQIFHDAIEPHVAGLDRAKEKFLAKRTGKDGAIRLGWTGTVSIPYGPKIIAAFTRAYPKVEMHARGGSSSQIIEWVANEAIDIGASDSRVRQLRRELGARAALSGDRPRSEGEGRDGHLRARGRVSDVRA